MAIVAGVDFGTLSVRVTLFDSERAGQQKGGLATASASYSLKRKREDPDFATQSHQDQMDALVIAMREGEGGWKVINPYVAEQKINYPILLGNEEVNQRYGGIEALPTTLLIGRDGKVAYLHAGLVSRSEYEKEILQLLVDRNM